MAYTIYLYQTANGDYQLVRDSGDGSEVVLRSSNESDSLLTELKDTVRAQYKTTLYAFDSSSGTVTDYTQKQSSTTSAKEFSGVEDAPATDDK